jgi:hypothetical protein
MFIVGKIIFGWRTSQSGRYGGPYEPVLKNEFYTVGPQGTLGTGLWDNELHWMWLQSGKLQEPRDTFAGNAAGSDVILHAQVAKAGKWAQSGLRAAAADRQGAPSPRAARAVAFPGPAAPLRHHRARARRASSARSRYRGNRGASSSGPRSPLRAIFKLLQLRSG